MPSDKHPHGTTFHQSIVLAIVAKHQPITSSQIAEQYQELTGINVAYNYQYIITRRMAARGLIKSTGGKKVAVLQWAPTPKGKKLLADIRKMSTMLAKIK